MAVPAMVRVLAITDIVVGALLIIFCMADGVTSVLENDFMFDDGFAFFGMCTGIWMCIAGSLGIPGSTPQRTQRRNCFAGVFMGFSISSVVFGGIIIIFYSTTIADASYPNYHGEYDKYGPKYPYNTKLGLAIVILILGIIEVITGVWVSICLCLMKPCCTHLGEREPLINSTSG